MIRAIHDHVLFTFNQPITEMHDGSISSTAFKEQTSWGFEFSNFQESTEQARWGTVLAVGPRVDPSLSEGDVILIEPLKWTNDVPYNGVSIWRTDDSCILAMQPK